jgi:hypothetical protein
MGFFFKPTMLESPVAETAEHGQADPDAPGLQLLRGHEVLVAAAELRHEVRDQQRPFDLILREVDEIGEVPPVGVNAPMACPPFDLEVLRELLEQGR